MPSGQDGTHDSDFVDEYTESMSTHDEDNEEYTDQSYLCDPLLSYVCFSMNSATGGNIKKAVMGYFTPDAIFNARDKLWGACDASIIGNKKRRNDLTSRLAHVATVDDIMNALVKLDAASRMPNVVILARDLHLIPRSHPEELNNISLISRLNRMEKHMSNLQVCVYRNTSETLVINDKLSQMPGIKSYASAVKSPLSTVTATSDTHIPLLPKVVISAPNQVESSHASSPTVVNASIAEARITSLRRDFGSATSQDRSSTASFREPRYVQKKTQRKTKFVAGASSPKGSGFKGAPAPDRYLFIYRVDKSIDGISEYLTSRQFQIRKLECISNANAHQH